MNYTGKERLNGRVNRRKVKMHRILTGVTFVIGGMFLAVPGWLWKILFVGCLVAASLFMRNQEEAAIAAYCAALDQLYVSPKNR